MPNPSSDVIESCVSALADFLSSQIAGLTVFQEWPSANQALSYPSLTISTGASPKRTPSIMVQVSQTEPDSNNQIVVNEHIADWDDNFQLDLWTATKPQRTQVLAQIIDAFSSQEMDSTGANNANGLSISLPDQYGEIARFDIGSVQRIDDEASAQRQERRVKISVLVNCREIRQRTYYAMKQILIATEVSQDPTLDSSLTDTEQNAI